MDQSKVHPVLEKRMQRRNRDWTSIDQTTLYFTVVRGVLYSWQTKMQAALGDRGEELLWGRQPGSDKGKCLVVSGSCTFHCVRGYLGSVGVSAWDFWDPGELTLYFRPWRGVKKGGGYFLLRRVSMMGLGQIAYNSSRVLNWSCLIAFSWRNQSAKRYRVVYSYVLAWAEGSYVCKGEYTRN
jgi:hypothetical protein